MAKEEQAISKSFEKRITRKLDSIKRTWYKFSRNWLSLLGLVIVATIVFIAIFAPFVVPYPQHAGRYVDFKSRNQPPSRQYLLGTDTVGRDILSRIIFAYRNALLMAIVVLAISVPIGTITGLTAGYYTGTWVETVIMRIADVFISIPHIILALTIAAMMKPTLMNSMIAVTVAWWPAYTRLNYTLALSISNQVIINLEDNFTTGSIITPMGVQGLRSTNGGINDTFWIGHLSADCDSCSHNQK
jgi:peptide/nickel transport system permease protein